MVSRSKDRVREDPQKSIRIRYHIWASQQVLSLNVDARRQQLQQAVQVHHRHHMCNSRINLRINLTTFNQNIVQLSTSLQFVTEICWHSTHSTHSTWPELRGFHTAQWQHPPSGFGRWNLPRYSWSSIRYEAHGLPIIYYGFQISPRSSRLFPITLIS